MSTYVVAVTGRYGTSEWGPFDREQARQFARDVNNHYGNDLDAEVKRLNLLSGGLSAVEDTHGLDDYDYDFSSSASRQHYIDTGRYLINTYEEEEA